MLGAPHPEADDTLGSQHLVSGRHQLPGTHVDEEPVLDRDGQLPGPVRHQQPGLILRTKVLARLAVFAVWGGVRRGRLGRDGRPPRRQWHCPDSDHLRGDLSRPCLNRFDLDSGRLDLRHIGPKECIFKFVDDPHEAHHRPARRARSGHSFPHAPPVSVTDAIQ